MKSTYKIALSFSIPLLLFAIVFFVVMRVLTRDRLVGVTEEPPFTIIHTDSEIPLDHADAFWAGIPPTHVHLWPQNARVPYGTEERDVEVRGVFNDREIGFLMEFDDATENREGPLNRDACAIFFGPGNSPATAQMMGHGASGNIWHWVADQDAESRREGGDPTEAVLELYTTGPGTQTPLEQQHVAGRGEHSNGRWYVVLKRSLESGQAGAVSLAPDADLLITFAVWDGEKVEALARKSISIMTHLVFERN
jgi:DMSO reductase family type II enzyme heme b subunit